MSNDWYTINRNQNMNLSNLFQHKPNAFDVSAVKYKKPIDEQLVNKLIDFLSEGKHKVMVRIDGGINSLVTGLLLKQALKINAVALIFDFGTPQTNKLVEISNYLKLESYVLKRGTAYQNEIASYRLHKPEDLKKYYKRFINYHLFTQAESMGATVVDIIDKSDRLLDKRPEGFYGHLMPFYSIYKSEVLDLARFLNVPDKFIAPLDNIDPLLFLLIEKQLSPEEISLQYNIDLQFLKSLKSKIDKQLFHTPVSQFMISG